MGGAAASAGTLDATPVRRAKEAASASWRDTNELAVILFSAIGSIINIGQANGSNPSVFIGRKLTQLEQTKAEKRLGEHLSLVPP